MGPAVRRVGVIGDVHAEDELLAHALDWFAGQRIDRVLCTGDLADGGGDLERCCALLREAGALTVRGNHDRWLLEDRVRSVPDAHRRHDLSETALAFLAELPGTVEVETCRGPLLLCHGVAENDLRKVWPGTERLAAKRSEELDRLLADGHYRYLVQGHSHYRVLVDFPELLLVNAGTLVRRHRPGVSIIDFASETITAYEFEGDRLHSAAAAHPLQPGPERRIWEDTQAFDDAWTAVALYGEPLP